jgi:hypothetical protein
MVAQAQETYEDQVTEFSWQQALAFHKVVSKFNIESTAGQFCLQMYREHHERFGLGLTDIVRRKVAPRHALFNPYGVISYINRHQEKPTAGVMWFTGPDYRTRHSTVLVSSLEYIEVNK